jgi:hypothetical protein
VTVVGSNRSAVAVNIESSPAGVTARGRQLRGCKGKNTLL